MPVFVNPGEHVLNVVPHVPGKLEVEWPCLRQAPVFQRALVQSEQLTELTLGEKPGRNLGSRVHTCQVRDRSRV